MRPGHEKSHKNKMAQNRNKVNGRKENGKVFYLSRCVTLDQLIHLLAVPDCLTKSSR